MSREPIEEWMHSRIPLSRAMGVRVVAHSLDEVTLSAPLEPNVNHKGTAFGGSLHALAALAGWSLITETLSQSGLQVDYLVIQDSEMKYIRPVTGDFEARAKWASGPQRERFLAAMRKKNLARVKVEAEILSQGRLCARLTGRFVAQMQSRRQE